VVGTDSAEHRTRRRLTQLWRLPRSRSGLAAGLHEQQRPGAIRRLLTMSATRRLFNSILPADHIDSELLPRP